jgi:hypothetical protein
LEELNPVPVGLRFEVREFVGLAAHFKHSTAWAGVTSISEAAEMFVQIGEDGRPFGVLKPMNSPPRGVDILDSLRCFPGHKWAHNPTKKSIHKIAYRASISATIDLYRIPPRGRDLAIPRGCLV